jgi:hypothetical protein
LRTRRHALFVWNLATFVTSSATTAACMTQTQLLPKKKDLASAWTET